jgi:hypothetical protein
MDCNASRPNDEINSLTQSSISAISLERSLDLDCESGLIQIADQAGLLNGNEDLSLEGIESDSTKVTIKVIYVQLTCRQRRRKFSQTIG